ncbi:DUF1330 domain-containing protein [Micromonospora vulcania]|uniref:DUF1330 domain-containing protein n=1 Tax=Micromonospora vulcania TaxID=1441873 RepID=A0ABW1H464_9ACTN
MATYLINHLRIPGGVPSDAGLTYLEQVEATVAPFGGKWLAQGEVQVLEGAWPGTVVLMEFPDHEAVERWYNSPEYRKILPLRLNSTINDLVLIDSLPAGFSVAASARSIRESIAGSK